MGRRSPTPRDELCIEVGIFVTHSGRVAKVRKVLDIELVLIEYVDNQETAKAHPCDLRYFATGVDSNSPAAAKPDLAEINDEELADATRRYEIILPLLDLPKRTRADVEAAAQKNGVKAATVYQWIKFYTETGHLSSLVTRKRGPKLGSKQLSSEVEAIIEDCLEKGYLVEHQPPPTKFFELVEDKCKLAGLKAPHRNTLRLRLAAVPLALALRRRGNREKADQLANAMPGEFPPATYPLECVQIDHCVLDMQVVFEETREPIGIRPWLTLIIDAFSRMIVGYFLSLARPSAFAAGSALYMGMMPKKALLQQLGLPGTWPIYGKVGSVHADNAREFKGKMLELACKEHQIISVFRTLKEPRYGAYIERCIGNVSREMQKKQGATQRKPDLNRDYDSVKDAVYTLAELEKDIVDWIVNSYHVSKHRELNTTPLRRYQEGIMGDGKHPGSGLPPIPTDPEKLRLDLMPFEQRGVHNFGVELDTITYYDPVLNKWINAPDPQYPEKKRQFIFRWDPRSIKFIWFLDPELNRYFRIPTSNPSRPDISWSEYDEYRALAKKEGDSHVDEERTFAYRQRSRALEAEAAEKTKQARKAKPRKEESRRSPDATAPGSRSFAVPLSSSMESPESIDQPLKDVFPENDPFADAILPFNDIEV